LGLKERGYWNTDPADKHDTAAEKDRVYVRRGAQSNTKPDPNPSEICGSFVEQMFGTPDPQAGQKPNMWGFLHNYKKHTNPSDPAGIMECYTPEQVPVLSQLAKSYAVCDRWFGSVPCETWPNRSFVHAGTSFGRLNNCDQPNTEDCIPNFSVYAGKRTIFDVLEEMGIRFGVYQDAAAITPLASWQFWTLSQKMKRGGGVKILDRLPHDLKPISIWTGGVPAPQYIFIEPSYGIDNNDQHPPHNVLHGEELISKVYKTLRESPRWNRMLLIITYDEHGGCYDHVPPPPAVPPDNSSPQFHVGMINPFAIYGPRVPAVLVSPYIEPGTVFRAPADSWLQNDEWNENYIRDLGTGGGLIDYYADTNPLTCPPGRIVTGVGLWRKTPTGNRVALRLQHANPNGSDPQWLQNDEWNNNYFGDLRLFYADTNPLTCPPGRIVTGVGLWRKTPTTGNRVALRLQHANPNGSDAQWLQNDEWNNNYLGDLSLFYADTNQLTCPAGSQLRGIAFGQKGANRVALRALVQGGGEYDHTSVLASLRDWIGASSDMLGVNERIRRAPTVWPVLTRTSPRADQPDLHPQPTVKRAAIADTKLTPHQINHLAESEAERMVLAEAGDSIHDKALAFHWEDRRQYLTQIKRSELSAANSSGNLPSELAYRIPRDTR
jgi:hypothetical protein